MLNECINVVRGPEVALEGVIIAIRSIILILGIETLHITSHHITSQHREEKETRNTSFHANPVMAMEPNAERNTATNRPINNEYRASYHL